MHGVQQTGLIVGRHRHRQRQIAAGNPVRNADCIIRLAAELTHDVARQPGHHDTAGHQRHDRQHQTDRQRLTRKGDHFRLLGIDLGILEFDEINQITAHGAPYRCFIFGDQGNRGRLIVLGNAHDIGLHRLLPGPDRRDFLEHALDRFIVLRQAHAGGVGLAKRGGGVVQILVGVLVIGIHHDVAQGLPHLQTLGIHFVGRFQQGLVAVEKYFKTRSGTFHPDQRRPQRQQKQQE